MKNLMQACLYICSKVAHTKLCADHLMRRMPSNCVNTYGKTSKLPDLPMVLEEIKHLLESYPSFQIVDFGRWLSTKNQ